MLERVLGSSERDCRWFGRPFLYPDCRKIMSNLFSLLFLGTLVFLGIAIFKPSVIKFTSRKKAIWLSLGALFLLTALAPTPPSQTNQNIPKQPHPIAQQEKKDEIKEIATTTTATTTQRTVSTTSTAQTQTASQSVQTNSQQITTNNQTTPKVENKNDLYPVIKIVDGDTIDVKINGVDERLRLIGINTPETVDPRKPVECFGKEASNKAKELLTGKNVKIEYDNSQGTRDKYNRLLAYVYREDGLFYNKYMIEKGYAYEYTYNTPYKYQADFKQAQATAKANKTGLWADGACNTTTPTTKTETTSTQPAPTTTTSPTGHVFYTSSHYSSKLYYCDTDSAWEGLSKKYLKTFNSEAELLAKYPTKTLNEPCK